MLNFRTLYNYIMYKWCLSACTDTAARWTQRSREIESPPSRRIITNKNEFPRSMFAIVFRLKHNKLRAPRWMKTVCYCFPNRRRSRKRNAARFKDPWTLHVPWTRLFPEKEARLAEFETSRPEYSGTAAAHKRSCGFRRSNDRTDKTIGAAYTSRAPQHVWQLEPPFLLRGKECAKPTRSTDTSSADRRNKSLVESISCCHSTRTRWCIVR